MRLSDAIKLRRGDTVIFYPWGPPLGVRKRYGRDTEIAEGTVFEVTPAGNIYVVLDNHIAMWTSCKQVFSFSLARRWPDGQVMNDWVQLKENGEDNAAKPRARA
jgi:translation initiation factor IF-1